MDLYAQKSAALAQKWMVIALEIILIAVSAYILVGGGAKTLTFLSGDLPDFIPTRRYVVLAFSLIIFARMCLTMFYLMKRKMAWSEALTVPFAFALYYVGFAVLVLPSTAPLGLWDGVAIVLFIVGCTLNTGGELQRDRFKKNSANKGRLYTGGFFALSMHINFFGDILWVSAYALVTQNPWSILIIVFISGFFAFYNVPLLDRHLAAHYGDQFTRYAARTKKLVPLVW